MNDGPYIKVLLGWFLLIALVFLFKEFVMPGQLESGEIVGGFITVVEDERTLRPGYSVSRGETIGIHLHAEAQIDRKISITDARDRVIGEIDATAIPAHDEKSRQPWVDGESIPRVASWLVPRDLKSGVYFVAADPRLYFVVRPDAEEKIDLLILISSNSFNAGSITQGRSMSPSPTQVSKVSFYRTMNKVREWRWLPFLRWLAQDKPLKDQQIGYITDIDMETDRYLQSPHALMLLAPAEYWTRAARLNFDRYVARGGNAIVYNGGSMIWQVRYEGEDNSVLTSYKQFVDRDPMRDTPLATLRWRDPRLGYPVVESIGGDYVHGGLAKYRREQGLGQDGFWVFAADHPVFSNTGLTRCEPILLYKNTLYDGMPLAGLDAQGFPLPDLTAIGAHEFNLLAFDWGYRQGHTIGTMHIFKPGEDTGFVFNLGVREFARNFVKQDLPLYAKSATDLKQIFVNLVVASANGDAMVVDDEDARENVFPMHTPYAEQLSLEAVNFECPVFSDTGS